MIGQTLSHYVITDKLGEGGMGVVYRAMDQKLERAVALKVLPERLASSADQRARFVQEAKAASALSHPNVATVHGIEDIDGQTFIVLEYIEGETLLDKEQLSYDEIIGIARAICDGLQAAHSAGIIHRDIKSENIMLTHNGRVKITDFGVAKLAGQEGVTDPGVRVGTLAYTSPEMILGNPVDHRTDLWSLGILLYELITGKRPFTGSYDAAILYEILNAEPPSLRALRADVPENLEAVVLKLLEKDPDKRPASGDDTAALLTDVVVKAEVPRDGNVSISVLYFENMSPDKDNEYVCAGITEDIITDLSRIEGLDVVSRNDVMPFRKREINSRELGETLGVDYVLEGSVRKSGDRLRITTQLTDVATGFHVWAERFDRLVEDIFEMQNEVARKVAEALQISLTESEKKTLAQKPTDDVRAYDFYLRAREFLSHRGKKKALTAIQMLQSALAIDPEFVLAYTGLVEAYSAMFTYYDGGLKWLERIIEANQKALALDPGLIEAQFSLGLVYFHEKDFDRAREKFTEVSHRRPYHYDANWWLGVIFDITGDYDSALECYEMCSAIKPYSVEPWLYMNMTHRRKGDDKSARLAAKRFLEVGLRKLEANADDDVMMSRFAVMYVLFGEKKKARESLKQIMAGQPDDGLVLYNCASTYALLGDEEGALRALRVALENGFKNIGEWVRCAPDFAHLRKKKMFRLLLNEFNLGGE